MAVVVAGPEARVTNRPDVSLCESGIEIRWTPEGAAAPPTRPGPYITNEVVATLKPDLIEMVRLAGIRERIEGNEHEFYVIELYLSERGREELKNKMSPYQGREYRVVCGSTEAWVSNAAKRPSVIRVGVRGTRERVEAFARTLSNDVAWE
jgi:hypothetical protein